MEEEVNKNVKITGCLTVLLNHIKNNGAPFLPKMEGAENLRRLYDKVVAHVALTCGSRINFDLAMEVNPSNQAKKPRNIFNLRPFRT